MAIVKTTLASSSYVTTNGSTTTTFTPVVEAQVVDFKLVPEVRVTNPGMFTAGTPIGRFYYSK